jgi:hypothetical protein
MTQNQESSGSTKLLNETLPENITVLKYSLNLLDELNQLKQQKRSFDTIIVDTFENSFFFPAEILIESTSLAKDLLNLQGTLVFVGSDKATAIVRDSGLGHTSLLVFHNFSEVYDYSPSLVKNIENFLGTDSQILQDNTSLSEQILLSSTPVLTYFGIKLKANMDSSKNRNLLLAAIDNYTPLSTIVQRLSEHMSFEESLDEIRSLDEIGAIYPIFAKIPFLVHSFRNQITFDLKNYLIETNMVNKERLEQLLADESNVRNKRHFSLGTLCVANDLISSRQLEIILQDLSYYGQPEKTPKNKNTSNTQDETKIKSLAGYLGNTDAAGILQSLCNNRETGILSVEYQSLHFRAIFSQGKLTHCNQGKLKGNEAIIEFVSTWREGVFAFIERQPPPELMGASYQINLPIDKLLLDAALASDIIESIWKKLPQGINSVLERVPDSEEILKNNNLEDLNDKTKLNESEINTMKCLYQEFDGLSSISATIKRLSDISTYKTAIAVNRLMAYNLVKVPDSDLYGHIGKFQQIVKNVENIIGIDQNVVFLRLSLQSSQGYSVKLRMFTIGLSGEIGFDLASARQAQCCLSDIAKLFHEWQSKYIDYISKELDKEELESVRLNILQDISSSQQPAKLN